MITGLGLGILTTLAVSWFYEHELGKLDTTEGESK